MRRSVEKPYFAIRESESEQARPTHDELEIRAYEIYIDRGRADGHDLENWLQAGTAITCETGEPQTDEKKSCRVGSNQVVSPVCGGNLELPSIT